MVRYSKINEVFYAYVLYMYVHNIRNGIWYDDTMWLNNIFVIYYLVVHATEDLIQMYDEMLSLIFQNLISP